MTSAVPKIMQESVSQRRRTITMSTWTSFDVFLRFRPRRQRVCVCATPELGPFNLRTVVV